MVARFIPGLIQGRLRAREVPVFGPSDGDDKWVWSGSCPWSCVVRHIRRSVPVSPSPLVLRCEGTGYGSRRFERRARLGTALLVPTNSRGSGDIVVIPFVDYRKA